MKTKIYNWYKRNSQKECLIDLDQAFEIMLDKEEKNLSSYINDFKIVEEENSYLGTYSNETKEITINKRNIEALPYSYLYAIETIRHEMEHARNLQTLESGKRTLESLIIHYALKDYAILNQLDFHYNADNLNPTFLHFDILQNYKTNPSERLAEIKAWKYLVNLLKNQRTSKDLLFARKALYYSYIRGYSNNRYYLEAPTYQFLLNTKMFHEYYWLTKRVQNNDYCFETRLTYGLPITEQEYQQRILQKVKLQKKKM